MTRLCTAMLVFMSSIATAEVSSPHPAGVEFPRDVQGEVEELRSTLRTAPVFTQHSAQVVDSISKWVSNTIKDHSTDEVVAALRTAIPVELDEGKAWRPDRDLRATPDVPIAASIARWHSANREVVVLRVDRIPKAEPSPYLLSSLPMLIAKVGSEVVVGGVKQWNYLGDCKTMCSFHGFIPGPADSLPDVLLSMGPKGTGSFVTFAQVHFSGGSWNTVWEDDEPAVAAITFDPREGVLSYRYGIERVKEGTPPTREEQVRLKYGGR